MITKRSISLSEKLFAHIETCRPYTVLWCGLISLSGACFAWGMIPPLKIALLSVFAPVCGWIAGLYLADYLDRDLDAIEKSHRPIPSGRISPNEALIFGAIFALSGTVMTLFIHVQNIIFIFIAGLLVYCYARYTKSRGVIGNINRGLLAVVAYYFGVFSYVHSPYHLPSYIILFSLIFFIHDINTNIIGTLRDIQGDKKAGYKTIPVRYGVKKSMVFSIVLLSLWLTLTFLLPIYYQLFSLSFLIVMIIDIIIITLILFSSYQLIEKYSRMLALKIHKYFIIERITLASAILILIINPLIAVFIYFISLFLTALFQWLLRNQYEFNKWVL